MKDQQEISIINLWGPLHAVMRKHLHFYQIKDVVGATSLFPMGKIAHLSQEQSKRRADTKGDLLTRIDYVFSWEMTEDEQKKFVIFATEEACNLSSKLALELNEKWNRIGWQYKEGKLIPLELVGEYDFDSIPKSSHSDIAKAVARFRDGDLTGTITAACGAIESACTEIYKKHNLGDISKEISFFDKVKKAIKANGKLEKIKNNLIALGWQKNDTKLFYDNFLQSLKQGAMVMQILRSQMGDVHGSKEALIPLVNNSIKWAMIILSMLS